MRTSQVQSDDDGLRLQETEKSVRDVMTESEAGPITISSIIDESERGVATTTTTRTCSRWSGDIRRRRRVVRRVERLPQHDADRPDRRQQLARVLQPTGTAAALGARPPVPPRRRPVDAAARGRQTAVGALCPRRRLSAVERDRRRRRARRSSVAATIASTSSER